MIYWQNNGLNIGSFTSTNSGNHVYGGIPQFQKTTGTLPAQQPQVPTVPNAPVGGNYKASLAQFPSVFKLIRAKK